MTAGDHARRDAGKGGEKVEEAADSRPIGRLGRAGIASRGAIFTILGVLVWRAPEPEDAAGPRRRVSTEDLRLALQRCRSFFDRLPAA